MKTQIALLSRLKCGDTLKHSLLGKGEDIGKICCALKMALIFTWSCYKVNGLISGPTVKVFVL